MAKVQPISKKNPNVHFAMNIIDEFDENETSDWDDMDMGGNSPIVTYFRIPQKDAEAERITNIILTKCTQPERCKILKIDRIQNPYLMASFLIKKHKLVQDCGPQRVQSRYLLHGTSADNVDSIAFHNFNLNEIQRSKHGHGINFTPDLAFASLFGDKTTKKVVIVARVIQAITCEGNKDLVVPRPGVDTTMNITDNGRKIIVKYDDDTFYPAYRVTYNFF